MNGHSIAGYSTTRDRVKDDFYATPTESTMALLEREEILYPALEPACGEGHIAKLLSGGEVLATDIVYRGYGEGGRDFITDVYEKEYKTVITNPPFNLFEQFVRRGLEVATAKLILFGKLQVLEGKQRATLLQRTPLRTVYVFKGRQNPLRNGSPKDENGKSWSSTMAFAWFVWEKRYNGKPQIEWI